MELLKVLPFPHIATKLPNLKGQSGARNLWKVNSYIFPLSIGLSVTRFDRFPIPGFGCLEVSNESVDVLLNEIDCIRG